MWRLIKDAYWTWRYQNFATKRIIEILKGIAGSRHVEQRNAVKVYRCLKTQRGVERLFASIAMPWRAGNFSKYKKLEYETYLQATLGRHIVLMRIDWFLRDNAWLVTTLEGCTTFDEELKS